MVLKYPYIFALCSLLLLTACGKSYITPDTIVNAPNVLGIKGYDPVAYRTATKAIMGKPSINTQYGGITYQFTSQENRQQFEASPEQYLPAYGGYCAYAMSQGNVVDINPRNWAIEDGQLYLNANIFAQGLWSLDKQGHIESADEKWSTLTLNTQEP